MAIGKWQVENNRGIPIIEKTKGISEIFAVYNGRNFCTGVCRTEWITEATLPYDYIIPEKVLQWMKEYQEQGIE